MNELKNIIADNLMNLRKASKLTQLELAEKLNYSDKAISKWERGESLPDVLMLKSLADMYNVGIEYLFEEHSQEETRQRKNPLKYNNKLIITLLSCLGILGLATIFYVTLLIGTGKNFWIVWLWTFQISFVVLLVFSSIWGTKKMVIISISGILWSLLTCIYCQLLKYNIWPIFLVGIPLQISILLAGLIKRIKTDKKEKN